MLQILNMLSHTRIVTAKIKIRKSKGVPPQKRYGAIGNRYA
jgi:hypothetical protein